MTVYLKKPKINNHFLGNHKHTIPKLPKIFYTISFNKFFCIFYLPCPYIIISNDHETYENIYIQCSKCNIQLNMCNILSLELLFNEMVAFGFVHEKFVPPVILKALEF